MAATVHRFGRMLAASTLAAAFGIACASFGSSISEGTGDDGGAPGAPDAVAADSTVPALDGALPDGASDAGPCLAGMALVPMPDGGFYCIDATEVTQAQYQQFIASKAGNTSGQIAACSANKSYVPSLPCTANSYDPNLRGAYPVSCVDWCDAYEYCRSAGKRLCGAVAGGAVAFASYATLQSQWYAACSHHEDGLHARAYGNNFDPARCNGAGYDAGIPLSGPIPAGSASGCVGGYPGIFDMMGNVYEWEDSCDNDAGCRVRGGRFGGNQDYHYCSWGALSFGRDFAAEDIGFRCCSP